MIKWKKSTEIKAINKNLKNNMVSHVGIKITDINDNHLKGTISCNKKTKQPFGILHGGASVTLAETLGSLAGNLVLNDNYIAVGLNISANYVKAVRSGIVTGVAMPIHIGKSTQIWTIDLYQKNVITCVTRLTLANLKKDASSY